MLCRKSADWENDERESKESMLPGRLDDDDDDISVILY